MTVRTSTLRALSLYRSGGKNYDDVLRELMEEVPPELFLRWAKEELKRPTHSLAQVRKRLGLPSP
jgi:hypothetical protein